MNIDEINSSLKSKKPAKAPAKNNKADIASIFAAHRPCPEASGRPGGIAGESVPQTAPTGETH
jgi:hypothetical protein